MRSRPIIAFLLTALLTILLVLPTGPVHRGRIEAAPPTVAFTWLTERVDAPKVFRKMSDHSLAIDTAGHVHLAYGADFLYYATYDGSSWQVETVDDSGYVGQYAALTLDAAGRPHISYYDVGKGSLKYAYFDGRWWHIFEIDSGLGRIGGYTSLALTASGQPRISYYDGTNAALKYAIGDGSTWITETVDTDLGFYPYDYDYGRTSLALDGADRPHIAYYDDTNTSIKYAHHDGTVWQIQSIDTAGPHGNPPSLVVDSSNRPHIGYGDGFDVKHAWYNGVTWQNEVVVYEC